MFDIVGLGSALMDFTVRVDDAVLVRLGLKKGTMQLIDEKRSREILDAISHLDMNTTPGGSSANTVAGVANLGGSAVFMGKVGNDEFGNLYRELNEKAGITVRLNKHRSMTGHAITFITPDSQRTFATHLGAAMHFRRDDIVDGDIRNTKILHIEGYMLEHPDIKAACVEAMELAKAGGAMVSIDLADPSLIERNSEDFKALMKTHADILFVNEEEAFAFTGAKGEEALHRLSEYGDIAIVKLGEQGSIIKSGGSVYRIPAFVTDVVNTNGAGDMYAAGMLYGISHGFSMKRSGMIGSYMASLVVAQVGARLGGMTDVRHIGI